MVLQNQVHNFGLFDDEIGLLLKQLAHPDAILLFVALCSRRPDSRPAARVQQPKLDSDLVGQLTHDAAKSVDLADEMSLGNTADSGITGHLCDQIEIQRHERCPQPHSRRCDGSLATRVAGANDQHVVTLGEIRFHEEE